MDLICNVIILSCAFFYFFAVLCCLAWACGVSSNPSASCPHLFSVFPQGPIAHHHQRPGRLHRRRYSRAPVSPWVAEQGARGGQLCGGGGGQEAVPAHQPGERVWEREAGWQRDQDVGERFFFTHSLQRSVNCIELSPFEFPKPHLTRFELNLSTARKYFSQVESTNTWGFPSHAAQLKWFIVFCKGLCCSTKCKCHRLGSCLLLRMNEACMPYPTSLRTVMTNLIH